MANINKRFCFGCVLFFAFILLLLSPKADASISLTNGSVSITQNGQVLTVTPSPATGYEYSGGLTWTVRGTNNSSTTISGTDTTYTLPDEDVYTLTQATANFAPKKFTVTYSAYGDGAVSGSVASGSSVDYQTEVKFTATSNAGVNFEDWGVNGTRGDTNPSIVVKITGNTEVVGYFYDPRNKVTIPTVTGGTVTASATAGNPGDAIRVKAVPDAGYSFVSWSFNTSPGNQVDLTSDEIVFIMPGNPITVTASFKGAPVSTPAPTTAPSAQTSVFTIAANDGGVIAEGASGNFESDASFTVSVVPNEGFLFDSWVVSGDGTVDDAAAPSTIFNMGNDDTTLTANFKADPDYVPPASTYNITIESSTGGTVTTDVMTATEGTVVSVNATPEDGFSFVSWGSTSGITFNDHQVDSTFFTMPARDVSIKAEFEQAAFLGGPIVWAIIGVALVAVIAVVVVAIVVGKSKAKKQMDMYNAQQMYNTQQMYLPPQYRNNQGGYGYPPMPPMGQPPMSGVRRNANMQTGAFNPITDNMVEQYNDPYMQNGYNQDGYDQNGYQNGPYQNDQYQNGYNEQYDDEYSDEYDEQYTDEYDEGFDPDYDGEIEYEQEYPDFSDDEIQLEDEFFDPTLSNSQSEDYYDG